MNMVEIATNPNGYGIHVDAVLKRYAPERNRAILLPCHISEHYVNVDIVRHVSFGDRNT